ncbi:TPA: radical SAM protein [Candidatus Woesearchaeota archaeon]|nr:radical SAM protein [Candidatus Woesearchaeota archaeon]
MEIFEKAKILGEAGKWDSCGPKMCEVNVREGLGGIYHAKAEHKTCRIFKTLMDNSCKMDCGYCGNSGTSKCKKKRARYEPEELGGLFNYLHKKLDVNGLFLSSGVSGDPDVCTERMIEAVKIVRHKYKFRGYVHFKVLPGTSYEMVKQASELADRMSINIEAPTKSVMGEMSSCKDFKNDILKRQVWIKQLKPGWGQSTQMIVNDKATDKDVLKRTEWEYSAMELRRVYYSAFRPVPGTTMEREKEESLHRQNHLYNCDFLLREYKYKLSEFDVVMEDGMLPKEDPKLAIAMATFDGALDVNEATYEELIRVPGIGPRTAARIVGMKGKIKKYEDLHKFGGWVNRAKPFISVDGRRQKMLMEF